MATVIDLLRHLGQNAAPDGGNALAGPLMLPGITDSPLQLPLPAPLGPRLLAAWSQLTARKTLGHHALAFSAAQTGHPVALMGHGASPHHDLLLIALAQQLTQPQHTALWLLHEHSQLRASLIALAEAIGLTWLDAGQHSGRITPAALVIATPQDLHRRVLRFHDRGWRWLWPRLRWAVLPEVHRFTGTAAGHLQWLLRRVERLQADADNTPLTVLASLAPVADAEAALSRLQPVSADDRFETARRPLKLIAAPDGPTASTLIALWRSGPDRTATLAQLAAQLAAHRLAVTVLGRDEAETAHFRAALAERVSVQPSGEARVALISGIPANSDARHALLRAPYRLLILLAGDEPHERLFVAAPERILDSLPYWPQAIANPYISADQLICAAAELPLDEAEVDRWHIRELRDRLLKKHKLQPLPGADVWQPTPGIDPYDTLDPRTIGGAPLAVYAPDGTLRDLLAPALVDRCALPGQVWASGLRVAARDEAAGRVQLEHDPAAIETLVQATTTVVVREEQAARSIRFGKHTTDLTKGRVIATQQIVGLFELQADGTQRRGALRTPPETQWSAAACWLPLQLPAAIAAQAQATLGWSLLRAAPLIALAAPCALVTAYDAEQERLYLVETEPGGIGLITGLYDRFERLIEIAQALVSACAAAPPYRRVAAAEAAWLQALTHAPVVEPSARNVPAPPAGAAPSDAAPAPERRVIPFPTRPANAPVKPAMRPAIGAEQPFEPQRHVAAAPPMPLPPRIPERAAEPVPPVVAAPVEAAAETPAHDRALRRAAIYTVPPALQSGPLDPPETVHGAGEPSAEVAPELIEDFVQPDAPTEPTTTPLREAQADHAMDLHETATNADAAPGDLHEIAVIDDAEATPPAPAAIEPAEAKHVLTHRATQPIAASHDEAAPGATEPNATVEAAAAPDDRPLRFVHDRAAPLRRLPEPQRSAAQHMIEDLLPPLDDDDEAPEAGLQFVEDDAPAFVQPPTPDAPPDRPAQRPPERSNRPRWQPREPQRSQRAEQRPERREPSQRHGDAAAATPAPPQRPAPQRPERTRPNSAPPDPPARPPAARKPAPEPERPADVSAMIARMRRLREQREAEQARSGGAEPKQPGGAARRPGDGESVELRFHIGERVQCLPYGTGTVRGSRIIDGREAVLIDFPDYGEIEVDPAISLVRSVGAPTDEEDTDP